MGDDLEKEKEKEYKRWQGFASAVLIALTVLFAGTVIALPELVKEVGSLSIYSILCGLLGILLTVLWFALASTDKIAGRPAFLVVASCIFVVQGTSLFIALAKTYLGW